MIWPSSFTERVVLYSNRSGINSNVLWLFSETILSSRLEWRWTDQVGTSTSRLEFFIKFPINFNCAHQRFFTRWNMFLYYLPFSKVLFEISLDHNVILQISPEWMIFSMTEILSIGRNINVRSSNVECFSIVTV